MATERKKTIVFTVINDLTSDQRMQRICSSLQASGFDCILVGRQLPDSLPLAESHFLQKRLQLIFKKGKLFYIEYNIRLFLFLFVKNYDAVCSIDCDTQLAGFLSTRIRKKKWIIDAHEIFTDTPEVAHRKVVRKIWKWVERIAFQNADLRYTVGQELANYFEKEYNQKVEIVYNAPPKLDFERTKTNSPFDKKYILYQGALNPGRGVENMIRAMQWIDAYFVIIGKGEMEPTYIKLATEMQVREKIKFLGFKSPNELQFFTLHAHIGLNVSENLGKSYYLSLNNKFFDYMHAQLPSLINPFPEYIRYNNQLPLGLITESQEQQLAKNANTLLEDTELHKQFKENCRIWSRKMNWENESKKLVSLYHNLFINENR